MQDLNLVTMSDEAMAELVPSEVDCREVSWGFAGHNSTKR